MFFHYFNITKRKKFQCFLFAFPENQDLPRLVYSEKKEFAPRGANSFLYELTLVEKRGRNEKGRGASPESILIHFKNCTCVGRFIGIAKLR